MKKPQSKATVKKLTPPRSDRANRANRANCPVKSSKKETGKPVKKTTPPRSDRANRANRLSEPILKPFSFTGWDYQKPELDRAEARAKCDDHSADQFNQDGRGPEAEEARAQAAWWRALGTFPESDAETPYLKTEQDAFDALDVLLARAESHQAPVIPLAALLRHLLDGLHALAAHGDKLAGQMLLNTIGAAVIQFEMLADKKPELFQEYARGSLAIPGMISRNKEKCADNQALLEKLKQGEDCPLAILPTGNTGQKWRLKDRPANALAVRLWSYIEAARNSYELHSLLAGLGRGSTLPEWREDAKKLKPFSPETWPTWAAVAWTILDKGNHPGLHGPTRIVNQSKRGGYGAAALMRSDSKKALDAAFETIATGQNPKKTSLRGAKA